MTPFHLIVYRPKHKPGTIIMVENAGPVMPDEVEAIQYAVRTIGDQRRLADKLLSGDLIEGPPLVVQYAELFALGCMELKPEVCP